MKPDQLTLLGPPRPSRLEPGAGLVDDTRDAADGYWTPDMVAAACVARLADRFSLVGPGTILEPSVGGGAWVRACRAQWGEYPRITVQDIDPDVPGMHDPRADEALLGDFTSRQGARSGFDLVIGNPPYSLLMPFLERGLEAGRWSAWLLRNSVLGSIERRDWWRAHRPRLVATVSPRCKWEGPGARPETDVADPVFVVFDSRDLTSPTHLEWIGWR